MNGGYLMVSKSDTNLYTKLNNALTVGKPVLFYEDENTCYYIDAITKSGTDIVLTKGGKTITVESDGTITEVGDVLNPVMESIKDSNGNFRFIEGAGSLVETSGLTVNYNKWSLCGTHLMIVLAGEIDNGTVIASTQGLAKYNFDAYILDKIVPLYSTRIDTKQSNLVDADGNPQTATFRLAKYTDYVEIQIQSITLSADRTFRIQFDLLIDAE